MSECERKILDLICEINPYEDINVETELIETGILDSMSILVLVTELEEEYKITINEKMIVPENFTYIKTIAELVGQLCKKNIHS